MYRGVAAKGGMGVKSNGLPNTQKVLMNSETRWCRTYATLTTSKAITGTEIYNTQQVDKTWAFWIKGTSFVFGLHDGNDAPGWCIDAGLTHASKVTFTFNVDGGNVSASTDADSYVTDAWTHWVVTVDDNGSNQITVKFYKNAVLIKTVNQAYSSSTMSVSSDSGRFCIGAQGEYVNPSTKERTLCVDLGRADCDIAELCYWRNTVLDGSNIAAIYTGNTLKPKVGAESPCPLDEDFGNYDESSSLTAQWRFGDLHRILDETSGKVSLKGFYPDGWIFENIINGTDTIRIDDDFGTLGDWVDRKDTGQIIQYGGKARKKGTSLNSVSKGTLGDADRLIYALNNCFSTHDRNYYIRLTLGGRTDNDALAPSGSMSGLVFSLSGATYTVLPLTSIKGTTAKDLAAIEKNNEDAPNDYREEKFEAIFAKFGLYGSTVNADDIDGFGIGILTGDSITVKLQNLLVAELRVDDLISVTEIDVYYEAGKNISGLN
jgi:hypothetical protein